MALHYRKDGNLDMRYNSSKAIMSSSSFGSIGGGSGGWYGSSSGYSGVGVTSRQSSSYVSGSGVGAGLHYKKDGTLDRRYSSSKAAECAASGSGGFSSGRGPTRQSFNSNNGEELHYKKDGTLDKRYSSSKAAETSGSTWSRSTESERLISGFGKLNLSAIPSHIKTTKAGFPDMRTKEAKQWVQEQAASTCHNGQIPKWLPTLKDGTLDKEKTVVQEYLKSGGVSTGGGIALIVFDHERRDKYYRFKSNTDSNFKTCVQRCRREHVEIPPSYILPGTEKIKQQFKSTGSTRVVSGRTTSALTKTPSNDLTSRLSQEIPDTVPEIGFGQLAIGSKLGCGSFGIVRKAVWKGISVAVKCLHLGQLTRNDESSFVKEVKVLALIGHHPNLVKLHGYCTQPPALVMEYVSKGNLGYLLHFSKDNEVEAKITDGRIKKRLLVGIVNGMRQIHAVGVVHGDLKPANVLVTEDWTAKVTDFGLAVLRGKTSSSVASTKIVNDGGTDADNVVGGTGAYMAPELLQSSSPPDFSADVYSFGILLNELVQEEQPFNGEEAKFHGRGIFGAANYARLGNRPCIQDKTPSELRRLIQDCWDANVRSRPDFEEIGKRLTSLDIPNSF